MKKSKPKMLTDQKTAQDAFVTDHYNGQRHIPGKYRADASFYPHGSFGYAYRGNIFNDS
jgi:hypothetical protein